MRGKKEVIEDHVEKDGHTGDRCGVEITCIEYCKSINIENHRTSVNL